MCLGKVGGAARGTSDSPAVGRVRTLAWAWVFIPDPVTVPLGSTATRAAISEQATMLEAGESPDQPPIQLPATTGAAETTGAEP